MTVADLLKIELEKTQKELDRLKLLLPNVVKPFYCKTKRCDKTKTKKCDECALQELNDMQ